MSRTTGALKLAGAGVMAASVMALTMNASAAKSLRIENKRAVALNELKIIHKDGETTQSFVLASDVVANGRVSAKVPPGKCLFDVIGTFEDQSSLHAADMDLCRQNTIRLVK